MSAIATIAAAAGRQDDRALGCIAERAESVEELSFSGRDWVSLDRKLAAAVASIAHGQHDDEQQCSKHWKDRTRSKACFCLRSISTLQGQHPN